MSATANQSSGGLWNKFRSSTKSLSHSLSNLSVRTETDGDTVTSTVVHRALVKFYKDQEPFTGFPGWLGHKDDLPNEQKILKKQNHVSSNPISSGFHHLRKVSTDLKKQHGSGAPPFAEAEQHSSAGMSFHQVYMSQSTEIASESVQSVNLSQSSHHNAGGAADVRAQQTQVAPSPAGISSSSMMMRERLKRQNTRSSRNLGQS
ncbi:hypothetical protein HG536_0A09490 [Torulaspora globosa]|uniref:Mso1 N-terminal domain-containing protein n=1 Tax=Torulaspora globosa TaxID=48254 RepID=A0A7G3ZC96_9SACH|nr:uncharacterized protein HG536_0A09490 [Torulaspora globosa]QLL31132.1 hypothetical protein HG536_0A09490 [Torulaspora globosa]